MTTLAELNAMSEADFVAALGDIFEHSPWVPQRAAAKRPFSSLDSLHGAMVDVMWAASEDEKLALLRAHPQLAGREADAGTLTAHSTSEQDSVGLTRLTPEEKQRIVALNAAYLERHGFPFIIAVKLRTKSQIFAEFERRLANDREKEFATALCEVGKIARLRLEALPDMKE
ncbi:MAG TPA: 2-oxo-4-hydroxy-4-carboxy-5-ureidoimidazoline decarboxylase [Ferrovibrio sp.]|jgi:2-oxo-4-hydroxy-4-carboxy-5-ureidoimidazoline decarboxylase|uniref:2-oxo-4-hydroxy-4-carboxy-5-ureidoimidazoline decarboxylase n=1 Tax=Ferrovibrio sp. TaxID=1917215 RepID=UPI002B4B2BA9|nr:2-oxo-4-hydroxy-4-carboxy-5-ureidoimidazoline decarboxylase [Ferrovibrio sp.]HLT77105.1 2-oxo-4-hydroxy-4-carboxy-5-ureidoimidazoline decarboxylase [Ferrovibrio sp.]